MRLCVRTFRVTELQTTKACFLMTTLMQGNMLRVYIEEKKESCSARRKKKESLLRQVALQCERRKGRG